MKYIYKLILIILIFSIGPNLSLAHPGRLNGQGCHNSKKYGYHCHKDIKRDANFTRKITGEERDKKINEYFRSANENVGALSSNIIKTERKLDERTKEDIKKRDGYKCVICGSKIKLEVDHKRALMNGGSNELSNLATLCDECHKEKTKMDNSLRRKREK